MLFGSEEQKQSYLPRIAKGEISFAMGLTEPNAGSDLASASTAAVRDGDDFVVNGTKRFTSGAHFSDYMWTVVRTDPEAPKHRGISMLIVPLDAPGVRIEPLIDITGRHGFNEVFLEDVRVPAENIVGDENRGWYVNAATMDFERSGIARFAFLERMLDRALDETRAAERDPSTPPITSTGRDRLAAAAIRSRVGENLAYRVTAMQAAGELPNYEVSIAKLTITETIQQVSGLMVNQNGMQGLLAGAVGGDDEDNAEMPWGPLYLDSIRHTVGQGSAEIQRNVVATRGLGLPRG